MLKMGSGKGILIYLVIFFKFTLSIEQSFSHASSKERRSLIYPPTAPTRLQFICGIGIPVEDLRYESITSGYVLKTEYFLPTNATELHKNYLKPQTIHRRRSLSEGENEILETESHTDDHSTDSKQNDLSTYRWIIYKAMEELGNRMGLVGRACVLKSICEVASVPFYHAGGILVEIAHIVMTPSSSIDVIHHHSNNEYLRAEVLGRSGASCSQIFIECPQSLIEQFSSILSFSRNIFHV